MRKASEEPLRSHVVERDGSTCLCEAKQRSSNWRATDELERRPLTCNWTNCITYGMRLAEIGGVSLFRDSHRPTFNRHVPGPPSRTRRLMTGVGGRKPTMPRLMTRV